MIAVHKSLGETLASNPNFSLVNIAKAQKCSLEYTAYAVYTFLIQSFGLRFSRSIATKLSQNQTASPLLKQYINGYRFLSGLYEGLAKGQSPRETEPVKKLLKTTSFFSSSNSSEITQRYVHLLLSSLPIPYLEIECFNLPPSFSLHPYRELEISHLKLTENLYTQLPAYEEFEASEELSLFVTRCDGIRGLSWATLIEEWIIAVPEMKEIAAHFLNKHPLAALTNTLSHSHPLPLPKKALPYQLSFKDFVYLRTLDLAEQTVQVPLSNTAREIVLAKLNGNEGTRIRFAYTLSYENVLLNGNLLPSRADYHLLISCRILLNLQRHIPKEKRDATSIDQITSWVFSRNTDLVENLKFDKPYYNETLIFLDPIALVFSVQSLRYIYPSDDAFEESAFHLLIHLHLAPDYESLAKFLESLSISCFMNITHAQVIDFIKVQGGEKDYKNESYLCETLTYHFGNFKISPSSLFFELVIDHSHQINDVIQTAERMTKLFEFNEHEEINGDHLFRALKLSLNSSKNDVAFAEKIILKAEKYDLSINQKLHLYTICLQSKPKAKDAITLLFPFLEKVDLYIGHPMTADNAYYLLLLHPDMSIRDTLSKNFERLFGLRIQIENYVKQIMIPSAILRELSDILAHLMFNAPQGILPTKEEYGTRTVVNDPEIFRNIQLTVIQLMAQANFATLGVMIGPGDQDNEEIPFFKVFFPLQVKESTLIVPPTYGRYLSLAENPTLIPHTAYHGYWELEKGSLIFFAHITYEKTGKTTSVEVPLNLPMKLLEEEGEAFFTMLSTLYLDVCGELYARDDRPYQDQPIRNLGELLYYYRNGEEAWASYEPKNVEKTSLAPLIFEFLVTLKKQSNQALRHLAIQRPSLSEKESYAHIAADGYLYPNQKLPSCSLLPPMIPLQFHPCYSLSPKENLEGIYKATRSSSVEAEEMGALLVSLDDKNPSLAPLFVTAKQSSGEVTLILSTTYNKLPIDFTVVYPQTTFSQKHVEWQILMLKGRFYRTLVQSISV